MAILNSSLGRTIGQKMASSSLLNSPCLLLQRLTNHLLSWNSKLKQSYSKQNTNWISHL